MKLGLIGDIHGNYYALKAVIEECEKRKVDKYILLGDYIMDGPFIDEIFDTLQNIDGYVISGNKERYLINLDPSFKECGQTGNLFWTYRRLKDEHFEYMSSLPDSMDIEICGKKIKMLHNTPHYYLHKNGIFAVPDVPKIFNNMECDIKIIAHSHYPLYEKIGDKHLINPGSCGLSPCGKPCAEYAILTIEDDIDVELLTCSYNVDACLQAFYDTGLYDDVPVWSKGVMAMLCTGDNYIIDFIIFAKKMMKEKYGHTDGWVPDDVWYKAAEIYDYKRKID